MSKKSKGENKISIEKTKAKNIIKTLEDTINLQLKKDQRPEDEIKMNNNLSKVCSTMAEMSEGHFKKEFESMADIFKKFSEVKKKELFQDQSGELKKFFCKNCEGTGFTGDWEFNEKREIEDKIIEDCNTCDGLGEVEIMVIDKRIVSKDKKLEYDEEY